MSGATSESPGEWVTRTRHEQGLPAAVDDKTVLRRVSFLLKSARLADRQVAA